MAASKIHPDWEIINGDKAFNRFTMEIANCTEEQQEYLASIQASEPREMPAVEADLRESGIVTTDDDPDSLVSEYETRARRTDDIDINRVRFLVTERCNMGCPGCFVRFKYRNDEEFDNSDEQKAHAIIDFLRERNEGDSFDVHFLGGEPLIALDLIKETIRYAEETCDETDYNFSVTTNATIVDEEIASYLGEKDVTVGVSFDGWKELNDEARMYMNDEGTYDDAVVGYRKLKSHLDGVGILVTPQPLNIDVLDEVVEHLVTELSPDSLTVNDPFHSNGTWEVDGDEFAEKMKTILHICEEHKIPLISPASQIIKGVAHKNPKLQTLTSPERTFSTALSTDGRLSYHIMNYDEQLFPNGIDEMSQDRFEKWARFSGYQHEKCRDCVALNTCGGPDPIESYQGNGDIDDVQLNPERCKFYKTMTEWLVEVL